MNDYHDTEGNTELDLRSRLVKRAWPPLSESQSYAPKQTRSWNARPSVCTETWVQIYRTNIYISSRSHFCACHSTANQPSNSKHGNVNTFPIIGRRSESFVASENTYFQEETVHIFPLASRVMRHISIPSNPLSLPPTS